MDGLEAIIKIESNQITDQGIEEKNKYQINGKIYFNENEYFIRYKEPDLGNTWTIIKWNNFNNKKLTILRQGEVRAEQIFEEQKSYETIYKSPSGDIRINTDPKKVLIELLNKWEGNILLKYELTSHRESIGNYQIKIKFKGKRDD